MCSCQHFRILKVAWLDTKIIRPTGTALSTKLIEPHNMPNPDALWEDIQKLDDLYEELLWHPDDELQFTHDGNRVIIINKTQEKNK